MVKYVWKKRSWSPYSERAWPGQEELAAAINANGWTDAGWQNLTGGIVALHSAVKPA